MEPKCPKALTKADIINAVTEENGFFRKQSIETVEILLEILKQTLESGEDILISGFGKFFIKDKDKRRGRNPATGGELTLKARRVVTFRCSQKLRDMINR